MHIKHEIPTPPRFAAPAMTLAPGVFKNMLLAIWLVMAWLCCTTASAATSINAVVTPSGAQAPANVTLSIIVNVDPDPVTVTQVEYFNGAASLGVAGTAPFSLPLTNLAAGSYAIVAKATIDDPANPVLTSPPTPLTITAASSGGAEVYYIHTDHLNTPRAIVNQGNALVWTWESDGFGALPPNETPSGASNFVFNPRFPGQYYDGESNLHYNYFRDYDPQTGRYVQSDPIGLAGGINTYGYALGNPVKYTDPTGEFVPLVIAGVCAAGGCEALFVAGAAGALWWQAEHPVKWPSSTTGVDYDMDVGPMAAAQGNVADSQIEKDYGEAASECRLGGKKPEDKCEWLEKNAGKYSPARVKATQKAWGCRGSRHGKGGKSR